MPELILDHKDLTELSIEILSQGSSFRFQAGGTSMSPMIHHGDILTVQPVDPENLRVGDVAFYRSTRNRLVAHRVIAVEPGTQADQLIFTARGDSSRGPGEQVNADQILGQVVSVQRGTRIMQLETPLWRGLAYLWVKMAPAILVLRSGLDWAALTLMRQLGSLRAYRYLAGRWLGKGVHYRRAEPQDADHISLLYGFNIHSELVDPSGALPRQFQNLQDCGFVLAAYIGDRLVGSLTVGCFTDEKSRYPDWWAFGILVRLRYRGAGIGFKLLQLALENAAAQGATRLNLLAKVDNYAAIELFKKMGFQRKSIPELEAELESEVQKGQPRRIILSRTIENIDNYPGE